MSPTRTARLVATLACAALFAGCGSSSTTTSTSSSTPASTKATTSSTAPATTPTSTPPSSTTPSSTAPSGPIAQLAANVCNATSERAKLPAAMKAKVEEICHEAESGHQAQAVETARKICVEAIKAIPGPMTSTKEKALKDCTAGK